MLAVRGMLDAALNRRDVNIELLSAIRDAALDLGSAAAAARAQAAIARIMVNDVPAWILLADVLVTEGAEAAARAALTQVLELSPANPVAQQRMADLDAERYQPFHVLMGLRSPPWRIALRARHRAKKQDDSPAP